MLKRKKGDGSFIIELAVCMPLLIVLLIGAVNIASYAQSAMAADYAANVTARYYANHGSVSNDDLEAYAKKSLPANMDATVTVSDGTEITQDFTMRVKSLDGWKSTEAKSVVKPKTVTVTVDVELYTIDLIELPEAMESVSRSATLSYVATDARM